MTPPLTQVPAHPKYGARRTTPVVRDGKRGTITRIGDDGWQVITVTYGPPGDAGTPASSYGMVDPSDRRWCIDLTDATGRDHGLRALAAHFRRAAPGVWWLPLDDGRWSLRCEPRRGFVTFRAPGAPELSESRPEVPSLADINPNDPTLLPDGSRWVDAEALARVLVHVLGGAQ